MDATAAPPSKRGAIKAWIRPAASPWLALIALFSTLLLIVASAIQPEESLGVTAVMAAISLALAFGRRLREASTSAASGEVASTVALGAAAAFEVGSVWLQLRNVPWPPPDWIVSPLLIASIGWFIASAARHSRAQQIVAGIDGLLPGSMLAFAALYAVPTPLWNASDYNRSVWIFVGATLALAFAASSMAPFSIGTLCATFAVAGVLLGSLGDMSLPAVLGNTAFAAAGIAFLARRSDRVEHCAVPARELTRADLLLAPALVLLVFMAIVLRASGGEERQFALRSSAAAALVLLIARQILSIWMERQALLTLEAAHVSLSRRASLDALTQLPNRDALRVRLNEELERARRHDQAVSVCFVDIDFFKSVNDRFGHVAGDRALRSIADTLRRTARSIDFVGRYGGEEFLVVTPATELREAVILADRLRVAVERSSGLIENSAPGPLTISVGVAEFPRSATTLDRLIERADAALYVSKRTGRNRVTAAEETAAP